MYNLFAILSFLLFVSCSAQKKQSQNIPANDIERILRTLSADDMEGRAAFTSGAEKSAAFIEKEFKAAGLQPMTGLAGYRQTFSVKRVKPTGVSVNIDGSTIDENKVVVYTDKEGIEWSSNAEVLVIKAGENLFAKFGDIRRSDKQVLVLVDESFATQFANLREFVSKGRIVDKTNSELAAVFVLGAQKAQEYSVKVKNQVEDLPLFNICGMLPGKSRPNEMVIYSAHYDHIGILSPVNGDSIANGADDDASGVTAVIMLANHFKKLNNNERTLLFVAFAAEELGLVGSKYFTKQVTPDSIVAMCNIEMIGKESKFGKNAAFISGFERSDLGTILQKNLKGTEFAVHPDPYPEQNLFYRSDNASLAAAGVPAHTFSTDQIDKDKYYHTVDDEFETLDIQNIAATIRAIALSTSTIVSGRDTPTRVEKLPE